MAAFVIHTPDYLVTSAGKRCLHELADHLMTHGHEAMVTGATVQRPGAAAPVVPEAAAADACRAGAVAVYHERIAGNPLSASRVARWCLSRPGLLGGPTVFGAGEMLFGYSDTILAYLPPSTRKLCLPVLDRHIFYPPLEGHPRSGGIWAYRGKNTRAEIAAVPGLEAAREITRETPSHEALGDILRAAEALYTFDDLTALIDEARACGCPVVVAPDGPYGRGHRRELGIAGMAWQDPGEPLADAVRRAGRPNGAMVLRDLMRLRYEYVQQLEVFVGCWA